MGDHSAFSPVVQGRDKNKKPLIPISRTGVQLFRLKLAFRENQADKMMPNHLYHFVEAIN